MKWILVLVVAEWWQEKDWARHLLHIQVEIMGKVQIASFFRSNFSWIFHLFGTFSSHFSETDQSFCLWFCTATCNELLWGYFPMEGFFISWEFISILPQKILHISGRFSTVMIVTFKMQTISVLKYLELFVAFKSSQSVSSRELV